MTITTEHIEKNIVNKYVGEVLLSHNPKLGPHYEVLVTGTEELRYVYLELFYAASSRTGKEKRCTLKVQMDMTAIVYGHKVKPVKISEEGQILFQISVTAQEGLI